MNTLFINDNPPVAAFNKLVGDVIALRDETIVNKDSSQQSATSASNSATTAANQATIATTQAATATQKALEASDSEVKAKQYRDEAFSTTPSGYEALVGKVIWFDDNGILNIGGVK